MEAGRLSKPNKNYYGVFVCNPFSAHLQVVLAHPPASLAPVKGPRQEGIQTIGYSIFEVLDEVAYTPSLSFPLKKGIHKNKIHFFRNFLIFPKIFRSR